MIKKILPIITLLIANIAIAQITTISNVSENNNLNELKLIDALDSVFFDLTKSTPFGVNFVDIPVSIKTNDTINALDFEMKYNHTKLLYDSIYDHTGNLQISEYYNPSDSTIRFTSNSFTNYAHSVKLVSIRFKMLGLTMSKTDLHSIKVYLNGDFCSHLVIGNIIGIGIEETNENAFGKIYPNPAGDQITIEAPEDCTIDIMDISGRAIIFQSNVFANQKKEINIQHLANGMYIVKMYNDKTVTSKKVVVNK